jgi:DNA replicative helicase MCM subunit Mcm2 (Cdc46/Mcm family)
MEQSKNDANLLSREDVLIFIFKKLDEIDSEIGNEILVALRRRISERRNKDTMSLMRFLQSSSISRVDMTQQMSNCLQSQGDNATCVYGVQSSANTNTSATNYS